MTDWRQAGACSGDPDPDDWFSPPGPRQERAVAVCAGCLVQVACFDWSLSQGEPHGVWGGLTLADREDLGQQTRTPQLPDAFDPVPPDLALRRRALSDWTVADRQSGQPAAAPWRPVARRGASVPSPVGRSA